MARPNYLTTALSRLAGLPFRLRGSADLQSPRKALILKPGYLSQVMLTTPLLAALSERFPQTRFDWAVSRWARAGVAFNPRLTELIDTGRIGLEPAGRGETKALIARLRQEAYDTCFIPDGSMQLALIAARAGIPQRIGLDVDGRGFAHTLPVRPLDSDRHAAHIYFLLADAVGASGPVAMEFKPPDRQRTDVTHRLVDELEWYGEAPLVVLHPGGGSNPYDPYPQKCWPAERFVLLGNHLARAGARVIVVGAENDANVAATVVGLMSEPVVNWCGELTLGGLGALCEVASLYVGNDTGSTHVAAAVGCPTLALFGPTNMARARPLIKRGHVVTLPAMSTAETFSWAGNLMPDEVIVVAEQLLTLSVAEAVDDEASGRAVGGEPGGKNRPVDSGTAPVKIDS